MTRVNYNLWVTLFHMFLSFGMLIYVCESYVLRVEKTLGSVQKSPIERMRTKRNAVADKERTWDFGVVPYQIDMTVGFDDLILSQIDAAMRHWENYTCITFIERNATEHEHFIRFTKNESICHCCSVVGKMSPSVFLQEGFQGIWVGNCGYTFSIVHELGHAIGFDHEHQRPDRDDYVKIIEETINMTPEAIKRNYGKLPATAVDTLDEPYDFNSIMHYSLKFNRVILPKKGQKKVKSLNNRLSAIDIRKTNKLYKCPECGRTYLEEKASFTSPEYNNKLANRTHRCEWRIKVTDGDRIRLEITDAHIFESTDCKSDYFEVRDGYWHKSPLLGRFCGTNIPNEMISTGNRMVINYVSNHTKYRGFAANYDTLLAASPKKQLHSNDWAFRIEYELRKWQY